MTIEEQLQKTVTASRKLIMLEEDKIKTFLMDLAQQIKLNAYLILNENRKDLEQMDPEDPKFDRLQLTMERINDIANGIVQVAHLPNPINRVLKEEVRPNGLKIKKVSVPFGVIGVIYEARPNVTLDVFALCFKSGNACILKGGSDAFYSNKAMVSIIKDTLIRHSLDEYAVTLLSVKRSDTDKMLKAREYIDLIIPRGSQGLIDYVRQNSTIPVIETGVGVCHTYFDKWGDIQIGKEIVFNAKTRRPSVCNTLECLIIHNSRLQDLFSLVEKLIEESVLIYADSDAYNTLKGIYPSHLLENASKDIYGTEFLDLKMVIKTVSDIDEALEFIAKYGSKHSEAIVSDSDVMINKFFKMVDASAVYANSSTAFTDGAQFGLGAEIGISTQKLHARGPMGLEELTSYKWWIEGKGHVRPK